jgi:hypothetical protein
VTLPSTPQVVVPQVPERGVCKNSLTLPVRLTSPCSMAALAEDNWPVRGAMAVHHDDIVSSVAAFVNLAEPVVCCTLSGCLGANAAVTGTANQRCFRWPVSRGSQRDVHEVDGIDKRRKKHVAHGGLWLEGSAPVVAILNRGPVSSGGPRLNPPVPGPLATAPTDRLAEARPALRLLMPLPDAESVVLKHIQ